MYAVEQGKWLKPKTHGRPPRPGCRHSYLLGEEGGLIVFGGYSVVGGRHLGRKKPEYLFDVRELHLQDMEWRRLSASGAFPAGRFGHTAAIGSQMVVFGGYAGANRSGARFFRAAGPSDQTPAAPDDGAGGGAGRAAESSTTFTRCTRRISVVAAVRGRGADPRYGHSMTYVGAGHYLIFGGWDGTRPLNSLVDLHIPE